MQISPSSPIVIGAHAPYEHSIVGSGSHLHEVDYNGQPGGVVWIHFSSDGGRTWNLAVPPLNPNLPPKSVVGCATLAAVAVEGERGGGRSG